jgi:hypothetical protein
MKEDIDCRNLLKMFNKRNDCFWDMAVVEPKPSKCPLTDHKAEVRMRRSLRPPWVTKGCSRPTEIASVQDFNTGYQIPKSGFCDFDFRFALKSSHNRVEAGTSLSSQKRTCRYFRKKHLVHPMLRFGGNLRVAVVPSPFLHQLDDLTFSVRTLHGVNQRMANNSVAEIRGVCFS